MAGKNRQENKEPNPKTTAASTTNFQIEGRRIVHLTTLGKELNCNKCDSILSLSDCVEEKTLGLASILYVKCRSCKIISAVNTDKKHEVGAKNMHMHYDVNTKLVVGSCSDFHVNEIQYE